MVARCVCRSRLNDGKGREISCAIIRAHMVGSGTEVKTEEAPDHQLIWPGNVSHHEQSVKWRWVIR